MMRLLQQVLIADPDSHNEAYAPIARIINMLEAALEGKTRRSRAFHLQQSAEILVSSLFQFKVIRAHGVSEKEEMAFVTARITHWLDDLFAGK
jgi:hypothetical protein